VAGDIAIAVIGYFAIAASVAYVFARYGGEDIGLGALAWPFMLMCLPFILLAGLFDAIANLGRKHRGRR
jgi:hypothetical protein